MDILVGSLSALCTASLVLFIHKHVLPHIKHHQRQVQQRQALHTLQAKLDIVTQISETVLPWCKLFIQCTERPTWPNTTPVPEGNTIRPVWPENNTPNALETIKQSILASLQRTRATQEPPASDNTDVPFDAIVNQFRTVYDHADATPQAHSTAFPTSSD